MLRPVSKECVPVRMFWLFEQQQRQGRDCMPGLTPPLRRKYNKNNWQFCLDNTIQQQWGKKISFFPKENRTADQLPMCTRRVAWLFYFLCPENNLACSCVISQLCCCCSFRVLWVLWQQMMCSGKRHGSGFNYFYCFNAWFASF